jgi:hypothetical protein
VAFENYILQTVQQTIGPVIAGFEYGTLFVTASEEQAHLLLDKLAEICGPTNIKLSVADKEFAYDFVI